MLAMEYFPAQTATSPVGGRTPIETRTKHIGCQYLSIMIDVCHISLETSQFNGIPPKGPYPPCLCMADRALLA